MNKESVIYFKDYGFVYVYKNINRLFAWNRITKIIAYKVDLLTIDDIKLEIWDSDGGITISEEHGSWKNFTEKILNQYPEIDNEWYSKIVTLPFLRNETILYQRVIKPN
ncbi:hypothetical protein DVK85_12270 [Flavobacterium arcticum]|uniref:Uncharacterized protein n=1 Tax=Flavobacterium arcticum TaxID=1784713 RepID=A0A345HEF2_9FLAO|nr:hypothetical protein [Flavobacterium arcticum]AXG74962.1 hypothetical protein DVK85_12270 [Flavobacterium arcticum]KAF2506514.1 hypothetical protein E0W72_12845 [Flavobacterium arcticum]